MRVVTPDFVRLPLSDGDWIEVKRRLNAGEQRAMFARMYEAGVDGNLRLNTLQQGIAKVTAYLLDWSLVGLDGKVIPVADASIETITAALDSIDIDSFREIRKAIEAHEEAQAAVRAQEKNDRDGEKARSAISTSHSGVAGALSGSANSTETTTTS